MSDQSIIAGIERFKEKCTLLGANKMVRDGKGSDPDLLVKLFRKAVAYGLVADFMEHPIKMRTTIGRLIK